ncbi:MAG: hypothetical protein K6C37_05740 [Bacteroidales bacterium]|nr:hypothetical protein [Bacteroidales bacterium]
MVYRYRVSLAGLKGFARVYELKSSMTLYDFHLRLRDDLDFAHDQLIQFKALDNAGGLVARYGLFNLGAGAVDEVSLADTVEKGVASFLYFYDVTNRKSVIVTFEGESEEVEGVVYPRLVETKGPNPIDFENGYVAYEDLPDDQKHIHVSSDWSKDKGDVDLDDDLDDEDLDDEDEDGDDEDGKEIYDENE